MEKIGLKSVKLMRQQDGYYRPRFHAHSERWQYSRLFCFHFICGSDWTNVLTNSQVPQRVIYSHAYLRVSIHHGSVNRLHTHSTFIRWSSMNRDNNTYPLLQKQLENIYLYRTHAMRGEPVIKWKLYYYNYYKYRHTHTAVIFYIYMNNRWIMFPCSKAALGSW